MSVCAIMLTYNAEDMLSKGSLRQLEHFDDYIIGYSVHPWSKLERGFTDGTRVLLKYMVDEDKVIDLETRSEAGARNYLMRLAEIEGHDKFFFIDEDEFWPEASIKSFLKQWTVGVAALDHSCFRTFWGDDNHEVWPRPKHNPIVGMSSPRLFQFARDPGMPDQIIQVPELVDHYSWSRPHDILKEKIESYSHPENIPENWLENTVFKKKHSISFPYKCEGVRRV